jgi:molecular chaperone GrpE
LPSKENSVEDKESPPEAGRGDEPQPEEEAHPLELSDVVGEHPPPDEEAKEPQSAEERLQAKERELTDLHDRFLRVAADFDNFRKRAAKERSELLRYANEPLARHLIEGIDNLERAIAHADTADKDALLQGITLVESMLLQAFEKFGIKRFSAMGAPFDPGFHEAIQEVPSAEHPAGTVAFEVQKGYTYHDRLLRPARVVLSRGPASSEGEGGKKEASPEPSKGGGEKSSEGDENRD